MNFINNHFRRVLLFSMSMLLVGTCQAQVDYDETLIVVPDTVFGDSCAVLVIYDGQPGKNRRRQIKMLKKVYGGSFQFVQRSSELDSSYGLFRYKLEVISCKNMGYPSVNSTLPRYGVTLKFTDNLENKEYISVGVGNISTAGDRTIKEFFEELDTKRIGKRNDDTSKFYLGASTNDADSIEIVSIVSSLLDGKNGRIQKIKLIDFELLSPELEEYVRNNYEQEVLAKAEMILNNELGKAAARYSAHKQMGMSHYTHERIFLSVSVKILWKEDS